MAKYILSILRTQPIVVFSWGFHNAHPISNGLRFSVNGYLHQGDVEVVYDEGADLFVVNTIGNDDNIKQQETGVYLDCLVNVIDAMVETL
ncbi:MAG: hypothetical protein Q4F45_02495 [Alistipes sp.]|nr:hypothetical protein [Alistipes sp.]